jgi:hypothetical protein
MCTGDGFAAAYACDEGGKVGAAREEIKLTGQRPIVYVNRADHE